MLVQPTKDEGEGSERPSKPQPIPFPPHPSIDQHETQTNPYHRHSPTFIFLIPFQWSYGGNHEMSVNTKEEILNDKSGMLQGGLYPNRGGNLAKDEPTVHKDLVFNELNDDEIKTEDAQDVGRTRYVVHEEKKSAEKEVSTKDALNTDQPKVSTDRLDEGTDKQEVSTDKEEVSTDRPDEGTVDQTEGRSATLTTPTPTPTIFRDDETIAQVLLNMIQAKAVSREKERGVELKDVENIKRPMPTLTRSLLTLKPLPKINPKDKGKKKIKEDESDTES
ncbi:hypothetical protein Tco_1212578 [Tanacetum coccineum]